MNLAQHKVCVHLVYLEFINVSVPGQETTLLTALSRAHYHQNTGIRETDAWGQVSPPRTRLGQSDSGDYCC